MILEKIKARQKFRSKIMAERNKFRSEQGCENRFDRDDISLLNGESIDDYIEHRIETDKVLEGILKDIQGNIAESIDRQIKVEKLIKDLVEEKNLFDTQKCHNCANFDWMTEECTLPRADDDMVIECRWTPKK